MKTIAMKIVSGEELVGRFVAESPLPHGGIGVTMTHARVIGLQQDASGNYGVGLMDYVIAHKDGAITIGRDKIITSYEPDHAIEKAFLSQTSGLQLA